MTVLYPKDRSITTSPILQKIDEYSANIDQFPYSQNMSIQMPIKLAICLIHLKSASIVIESMKLLLSASIIVLRFHVWIVLYHNVSQLDNKSYMHMICYHDDVILIYVQYLTSISGLHNQIRC